KIEKKARAASRLAQAPNFAQQQTQIIGGTFEGVRFTHVGLAPQPSPSPATRLTHMRKGSFASFAAPAIQLPPLVPSDSLPIGPKCFLIARWLVGPAPALLPPLGNVGPHALLRQLGQQPVVMVSLVHDRFL